MESGRAQGRRWAILIALFTPSRLGCSAAWEMAAGQVIKPSNGTRWPSGNQLGAIIQIERAHPIQAVIANARLVRTLAHLAKTIKAAPE